jgi:hypothetical protein
MTHFLRRSNPPQYFFLAASRLKFKQQQTPDVASKVCSPSVKSS